MKIINKFIPMHKTRILGWLILLMAVLSSCGGDNDISNEAEYLQYINEFTAGSISKHSSIIVKLANPSAKFNSEDKDKAIKKIFEFSPKIEGEARWVDQYTIEFKPNELLKSGQEYVATFHLSEVQEVTDKKNNDFKFPFKAIEQHLSLVTEMPIYKEDGSVEVNGTFHLADREDPEVIAKLLSASIDGKPYNIEWGAVIPQTIGCLSHFKVSNIKSSETNKDLTLSYTGKPIGCEPSGKVDINVTIHQNKIFQIIGSKIFNGEDAHVEYYFNQALPAQDLKSKIYFSDGLQCNISKENSVVKVFPSKNFTNQKTLIIDKSLMGANSSTLGSTFSFEIRFESIKPAVKFTNNGSILPTTNGAILPFQAVSLRSVDVTVLKIRNENIFQHLQVNNLGGNRELKRVAKPILTKTINLEEAGYDLTQWQNYFIDLKELVNKDPGCVYSVILSFKKSYSTYPCDKEGSEENDDEYDYSGVTSEWGSDPDNYGYYYDNDYYSSYDDDGEYIGDNPCYNAYYKASYRRAQTNILVSDLGVIAKLGTNNKVQVIVTNLKSTEPESGAKVKFYNFQQELLGESSTNGDGFAEFTYEKEKPIFIEVSQGDQKNFLKINDASALSLSSFDVTGAKYEKGLKGYIYGERGVWRPGDTLNISLMLQDQEKMIPENHPIVMNLVTPRGQKYTKSVQKYHTNSSIYSFRIPTDMEAPTGIWNISFNVGGAQFSKALNIETVKPNRLKVKLESSETILHGSKSNNFHLYSEWLHGGKAADMKATVNVKMRRAKTAFEQFKDYTFESPAANEFRDEERNIYNGRTDANGNIYFNAYMPRISNAPGMLEATFSSRVFEGEGDFSINSTTLKYSPYSSYVGIKAPEAPNKRGIYYTEKDNTFNVVVVDENGNLEKFTQKITYKVYKLSWRWWWDSRSDDGLAYYINNTYASIHTEGSFYTEGGKGKFTINIDDDDWGRYFIIVSNEEGHSTGCISLFDWESCVGKSKKNDPSGATMLTFTTDKMTYNVGEKIKVSIPTTNGGRALVSLENRSRIISSQWVTAKGGNSETTFEIVATPDMVPNVYLNITLLQPHKTTANDLPIRMYGVQSITVEDKETILRPKIDMSDEVTSGKPFEVKISEENKQEMDYTLAIVDEGLLDITNFKTPNAHNEFFKREALGVNTWDIYDQVIGAYGGRIEKLFGIGGDDAEQAQEEQAEKRFKAIVKFIGPCKLGAGKKTSHKIDLPNYYGSVRVMVVAGNGKAYGNAEKAVKVTSPLMVLATLPRVAGPNEDLTLPVNVFNNSDKNKNVKITVTAGDVIKLEDNATKEASIEGRGDKVTTFNLKAANKIGKQKISVKATDGSNEASTEIWLEVRNPNPRVTSCQSITIEPGKTANLDYNLVGMEGTNTLALELGTMPAINLDNRLEYLIGYPHGCAEQTTSKGFPQLFLPTLCNLTTKEETDCETNVKNTIKKLEQMQMSDGSVSYWMGGNYTYDWVNNYVGDFMITAQSKGYNVSSFLASWNKYQTKKASEWVWRTYKNDKSKVKGDDFIQAYRLYTLAANGKPAKGAMNRLKEEKDLSLQAKWRLAGAYALIGDKKTAHKIIEGLTSNNPSDYNRRDYETFGSQLRDEAMVMEVLLLLDEKDQAFKLAQSIAKELNSNRWLSTQETAYALIAMSKLANGQKGSGINASFSQNGKEAIAKSDKNIIKERLDASKGGSGKVSVTNKGNSTLFVSLSQSGIPMEDLSPAKSEGLQLNISYYDVNGSTIDISNLQQGTDFVARVTVKNISSFEDYSELSLTQIFPSGWEILNKRLNGDVDKRNSDFSYQDIRDDRVLTYFNLPYGNTKTFYVDLHAAYTGRFFLPACSCEYMYDNSISARTKGQWVNVVK
ncbi:MAG: hypothetical protein IK005_03305 [Paludibacteraceae bacterium]|nr:hypothetical protein [Paludibacteraceae bacterium]